MKKEVVITGLGIVSSIGIGQDDVLKGLKNSQSGIKEITSYDTTDLFKHGGEVRGLAIDDHRSTLDRASVMLRLALREALEDSSLTRDNEFRVGVIVGSAQGGIRSGEKVHALSECGEVADDNLWKEAYLNRLLYHVSQEIEITGPELVISNACVSSTMALGFAKDAIEDNLADIMIVVGVDTMSRFVSVGFQSLRAVTENLCRPFDKNRDGIIPGEGAGVLILENAMIARCRGVTAYAQLAGYGSAADAVHMTAPDKEGKGMARAIKMALLEADLQPSEIDCIIPHGTGTLYNDQMEWIALKKVFGEEIHNIPLSSIKSAIGHTMGAAGILSAITGIMAINYSFVPANLNFLERDPEIPGQIVQKVIVKQIDHLLFMTSAFGGSNEVAVIKKFSKEGESCPEL